MVAINTKRSFLFSGLEEKESIERPTETGLQGMPGPNGTANVHMSSAFIKSKHLSLVINNKKGSHSKTDTKTDAGYHFCL